MAELHEYFEAFKGLIRDGGPWAWAIALAAAFLITSIVKAGLWTIHRRVNPVSLNTSGLIDDMIVGIIAATKTWSIFAVILYLLLPLMGVSEKGLASGKSAVTVIMIAQSALWGLSAIGFWRRHYLDKRAADDASSAAALALMYKMVQAGFVIMLVLIALSNLGVDIAALMAGLGVGGIAVALAAQNILGDLLASLSIVLDKPFVVGDFIVVGQDKGTVEYIGIKTTRVRSLSGELLVFSNKALLENTVSNFKRMWERRVVQKFGVLYSTPPEKLEQIPVWVKGFVEQHDKLRFDRCHFAQFGDSSLNFELVFWVKDADYAVFMNLQEQLLLDVYRKFAAERVGFAFPTQTLHIESWPSQPTPQS